MIVRILNEGQWELGEDAVRALNALDERGREGRRRR